MNLSQFEYLVAAVDLGSVSRAAEKYCISQQAVSKALKALESELGNQLLTRGTDGVAPTKACLDILPHARAVVRETSLVSRSLTGRRAGRSLRLAVPEAVVGDRFIVKPEGLASFSPAGAEVSLEIVEDMATRCAQMVADGSVDMAVVGGRPDFGRFSCMRLCSSAAYAFVGFGHPLAAGRGPVAMEELVGQTFLVPRGADFSVPEIQDAFYRVGVPVPTDDQFVFPECSAYLLMERVYHGDGVAFVDARIRGLVDESRAKILDVAGSPFSMSLNAIWAPGRNDLLLAELRAHLTSLLR